MRKLFIQKKSINIEKIAEKSLAQFRAQLKQAGVEISDERSEEIYKTLRHEHEVPAEVLAAKEAAEKRAAEIKAKAEAAVKESINK